MSYILEALRRAETERERKRRVPGLHAQPVAVLPVEESSAPRSTAWRWVALGLAGGLLLALLWRWWAGDPAAEEEALAARTTVAGNVTPHPGPADPAAARAAAPPPAPVAEATPAPAAAPTPTAEHAPTQAQPSHAAKPATKPQPRPTTPPATPTAAKSAHPTEPGAATAAAATTPATRVTPAAAQVANPAAASSASEPPLRTLSELPVDLQRAVPALSFGGSVYSELPAQRMVILNGQVLREGDAVSDEIRLEEIRPHSAVMRLRGQRFEMPF